MYTILIDESGQTGIRKIRDGNEGGASKHFTLGAVVVKNSNEDSINAKLEELKTLFNKRSLHCSELKHTHKVKFAREVGSFPVTCFGVISNKKTLGNYRQDIQQNNEMFFNKCMQYLLERIGACMELKGIAARDVRFIIEAGEVDLEKLFNFIDKVQATPLHRNAQYLRNIEISNLQVHEKEDAPLLQLADLIAHSLFKAVDKTPKNFEIPETRYLNELRTRFHCSKETKKILEHGIKPIHNIHQLELDGDVKQFFLDFRAD